ncbi:MAG TPA: hypothetical protein VFB69_00915 [Candidatus Dormibacteraeota bacterium]|nr:hypothetical protein [Candidatus Dormibacteraeota bacterium]
MKVTTDRGAIRALVLGLISMWFGVVAPFAIWTAVRALRRIRASGGRLGGEFLAAVGLAGGVVGLAVMAVGLAYWLLA